MEEIQENPAPAFPRALDGQCFLFVRSLTDDHPANATNDRVRWNFLPRGRVGLQCKYLQESRVALKHPKYLYLYAVYGPGQ